MRNRLFTNPFLYALTFGLIFGCESDCAADYMCVRNISAVSTLGECVSMDDYDPWANRQLEDIIKLENKDKLEEDKPEVLNPDSRWWLEPEKDN